MRATVLSILFVAAACSEHVSSTPSIDAVPGIDARIQDVCPPCPTGDICVATYDGTCLGGPQCVHETVTGCETDQTCSQACDDAYCNPSGDGIYSCMDESDCPGGHLRPPGVITCYGI